MPIGWPAEEPTAVPTTDDPADEQDGEPEPQWPAPLRADDQLDEAGEPIASEPEEEVVSGNPEDRDDEPQPSRPTASPGDRFTEEQDAVIQLAKTARRAAVSSEDARTLLDWAEEFGLPARGPEVHPGRPFGQTPHIHIGPIDHIPVR